MRAPLSVKRTAVPYPLSRTEATRAALLEQDKPQATRSGDSHETLVADVRALLTPSQMVEDKLLSAMNHVSVRVSQVRSKYQGGSRCRG